MMIMSWVADINKGEVVMTRTKKHMSQQDKADWEELYAYVRHNVLGYDENQSLSRTMVLRLKGLLSNKFIANNNIDDTANYSYKVVLNTFKFCMPDIQRGFKNNLFKDEGHRFNYVLKIVENNLNTVYLRMKNADKVKKEIENKKVDIPVYNSAEYKPKEKAKDRFADLW